MINDSTADHSCLWIQLSGILKLLCLSVAVTSVYHYSVFKTFFTENEALDDAIFTAVLSEKIQSSHKSAVDAIFTVIRKKS